MYTQYISTSAKYLSLMYFTINLRYEIRHDLVSNLIVITILKCLWPKQNVLWNVVTHFSNRWHSQGPTGSSSYVHQLVARKRETLVAEVAVRTQFLEQIAAEMQLSKRQSIFEDQSAAQR